MGKLEYENVEPEVVYSSLYTGDIFIRKEDYMGHDYVFMKTSSGFPIILTNRNNTKDTFLNGEFAYSIRDEELVIPVTVSLKIKEFKEN
jgi:hypothetical protein